MGLGGDAPSLLKTLHDDRGLFLFRIPGISLWYGNVSPEQEYPSGKGMSLWKQDVSPETNHPREIGCICGNKLFLNKRWNILLFHF